MSAFKEFWQGLDRRSRIGLAVGTVAIVGATVALGASLLRTNYQVLFADLGQQDAATMAAELDKMKTPYQLSGNGNTILVPEELVPKTRLDLVGKELPLRGAVGLELFNSSEVGMTEFTQKVNYQRALQGELTRTIQAIDEVQSVRVHLVLAEQGLFKKNQKQAKASISLTLKPGMVLEASQVQGIQRLVSAAVPDIRAGDVTITDQRGVALTRRSAEGEEPGAVPADNLDDKRAAEQYLNRKVVEVLDRTFGPGMGIATVDVTLSRDHSKVTTESVLGGKTQDGNGVLVRERVTSREGGDAGKDAAPSPTVNREADYQVGRRVEQVVSGAGAISRINVAVVVRGVHDHTQLERTKELVALAAGIQPNRGDAVAVYSMEQVAGVTGAPEPVQAVAAVPAQLPPAAAKPAVATGTSRWTDNSIVAWILAGLAAVGLLALALRRGAEPAEVPRQLSLAERQAALLQLNQWLDAPRPVEEKE